MARSASRIPDGLQLDNHLTVNQRDEIGRILQAIQLVLLLIGLLAGLAQAPASYGRCL